MRWKSVVCIGLVFGFVTNLNAQTCSILGQNPATAFPVCGTSSFVQQTVPACGGRSVPVPGCENDNAAYGDINPFWYKFTCFAAGTLGFTITPLTNSDDYDWQLFDITGRDAAEVYTNKALYIASNWSAHPGATGTTSGAASLTNCAGFDYPNKSKMPTLKEGHQYLLLVSHFTSTNQSGYKLRFDGGTANITNPKEPHLQNARAFCDGKTVIVRLNKKMRCNSLAADGSDFEISDASNAIISANAKSCNSGFDMDSISLLLKNPLPPGNYTVKIRNGSDENTLLDYCDRNIAEGEEISFSVLPVQPTPMDSLLTPGCAPKILQLAFRKPIRCSSIAPDGSDFILSGQPGITIISASGSCNEDNTTNLINIQLNQPLVQKGNFTLTLRKGSDGNTIIDECGQETLSGAVLKFTTKDTVSAKFDFSIHYDCKTDTVFYNHPPANEVNSWTWSFDDSTTDDSRNPQKYYTEFGRRNTTLMVSNGVCSDTTSAEIFLDNELKAGFEVSEFICPRETVHFKNTSKGNILSWNWTLGNGIVSTLESPPVQTYRTPLSDQVLTIRLIVTNQLLCTDTTERKIKLVSSCYIDIPSAFTPNGDQLNDYLYPLNAYKAKELVFRVYNLYGQKLFETTDPAKKWDGTFKGKMQNAGTYIWTLEYTHADTKRRFHLKGTTSLIR